MSRTRPLSQHFTKELVAVLMVALASVVGLNWWHKQTHDAIEAAFIQEQRDKIVTDKVKTLETAFATVYQNLRAISLLPSVRGIDGGNRLEKDHEDVIKSKRFTAEGAAAAQQIYNNMASQISVSEIYAVVDGLNAAKGEVPFFRYDAIRFGAEDIAAGKEAHSAESPEQSAAAAYEYFPQQMAAIKAAHPKFAFATMDDIPAFASPFMRTGDNTGGSSTKTGHAAETIGMLYSVPFYTNGGRFHGVISAIIRRDVFESLLLNVPFIPVTTDAQALQAKAGWKMPDLINFVLTNDQYGISLHDRRNAKLLDSIETGVAERNVFRVQLNVHSDSPWQLTHYLPEAAINEATAAHDRLYQILLLVVLAALGTAATAIASINSLKARLGGKPNEVALVVESISNGNLEVEIPSNVEESSVFGSVDKLRRQLMQSQGHARDMETLMEQEVTSMIAAARGGDFSQRMSLAGKQGWSLHVAQNLNTMMETSESSLSEVVRVFKALAKGDLTETMRGDFSGSFQLLQNDAQTTVHSLKSLVGSIKAAADLIRTAAVEIAQSNMDLSLRSEQQASNLEETAASMEEFASTVKQNADNARLANQMTLEASSVARKGGDLVMQVIETMDAINQSSHRIVDIIAVIDGIAFQTNILALNAAVEAARAGEQGRGFAVVAAEVRALAQRSAAAAKEIKALIGASADKIKGGSAIVKEAGNTMAQIVDSVQRVGTLIADISTASVEQYTGIEQVNQAVLQMEDTTQQNAARVEEAAAAAKSLEDQALNLQSAVSMFRLPGGESAGAEPSLKAASPAAAAYEQAKQALRENFGQGNRFLESGAKALDEEWESF